MTKLISVLVAILLSIITVFADFFIKKASLKISIWNKWLLLGAIVYGLTAVGWVYVMKNMKLSTLGAIYGVSCIILLTLVSVFILKEKINILEFIGILLGVSSIIILYRYM